MPKKEILIKMVMSEVLSRVLLHPHMLCQLLFKRVCYVALITIKMQILHSQSKNRNIRNHEFIPQFLSIFSILSRCSRLLQKCHQSQQLLWLTSPSSLVF